MTDSEWVVKFPVNSIELSFFATLVATSLYIIVSLLTCRRPFNLEKMLHRGQWADSLPATAAGKPGAGASPSRIAAPHGNFLRRLLNHLVGINAEYTREDRILAWTVFGYSICYGFFGTFVLVALLAKAFHWTPYVWTVKMLVTGVIVPLAAGIVTTAWFTWGTTRDIRRLFRDLETRVRDDRDNGMVEDE